MARVNVFEVKAKLSYYLERAAGGERIVICRHNKPVAELRPVDTARTDERPIGPLPGRPAFEIPASFFEPLPDDELDLWDGAENGPPKKARAKRPTSHVAERAVGYGVKIRRPAARRRR